MSTPEPSGSLFPYQPRPSQRTMLERLGPLASRGGMLLLDAPTGAGKTVGVLAPLLEHAIAADHRILYLVRTHSQAGQVMAEIRAIARHSGQRIVALSLEGRDGRCPLMDEWEETRHATSDEYSRLCNDRKRATEQLLGTPEPPRGRVRAGETIGPADLDGCPYYSTLLSQGLAEPLAFVGKEAPTGAEFTTWTRERGFCPYETAKLIAKHARVVVAPYVMFFHPAIRDALLGWMGAGLGRVDLVVDEAHNLPEFLRELGSATLTEESISRALREVEARGDFVLVPGVSATVFLHHLRQAVSSTVDEATLREEEGILPDGLFEGLLLGGGMQTSARLEDALATLAQWGDELREARRREHRLPRSYAYIVARFLSEWGEATPPGQLQVALREPRRGLMIYGMDAAAAAVPAAKTHTTVCMSGTLAPLEEYRDGLRLPESAGLVTVPSSFPPENRRLFYSSETTTRHQDLMLEGGRTELRRELVRTARLLPVKTAVFFPSFALLEQMLSEGLREELERPVAVERRELSSADLWHLVDEFKQRPDSAVLLGVCGGRIAEGLDFPDETLGAVIVVGIPYPRPSARREALRIYLDQLVGQGWEHCYGAPARRAILQALGRMIRSETDRGIGVILDHRASRFSSSLEGMQGLGELEAAARDFYRRP